MGALPNVVDLQRSLRTQRDAIAAKSGRLDVSELLGASVTPPSPPPKEIPVSLLGPQKGK